MEFCFQKFYKILSLHFMLCLCFFLLEYRAVDLNFFFAKLSKYLWHSWIKSIRGVVSLCHKTFLEIYIVAGFYLILGQHISMIIFQCKLGARYHFYFVTSCRWGNLKAVSYAKWDQFYTCGSSSLPENIWDIKIFRFFYALRTKNDI